MDMRIPALNIQTLLESKPLKSRILVRRLAVESPQKLEPWKILAEKIQIMLQRAGQELSRVFNRVILLQRIYGLETHAQFARQGFVSQERSKGLHPDAPSACGGNWGVPDTLRLRIGSPPPRGGSEKWWI